MSELSFAKSFLTTLSSRPSKISPTHAEDPKSYPPRGAYILPKLPKTLPKRRKLAPGAQRTLTITLRSARNPPIEVALKQQSPLLSVLDLKAEVSAQANVPVDKIKILHRRKPVGDAKVVEELVGEEDTEIEFGIMVIGGAASVATKTNGKSDEQLPSAAVGESGREVFGTEAFWTDLRGFLAQRVKDAGDGERAATLFREAWEARNGAS
ncbi:hypothetical protein VC83_00688 [Pseudogymnoascus destructans]|uniref:Ubiquitin-like domain-containing protein n=2 Tax=Pseudogymnoascus destructans TaxID=655981 RepID=L8FUU9_PSED2|nr:uncharacterized protein VC83_00688 [Pseudogymnoascus destructans]ELR04735.1 hypothetical protein GMDG_06964 [Pseudogymnoascus destructans 20631-21]OAF62787.1 hypothetical protein VC83_00688 [Pseudogymnoascus destructans]